MQKTKPKIKTKNKDSDNFDFMKTNKDNIANIIKDSNTLITINDLVNRVNKIVIHAYQFLKLYLIHLYDNNKSFPIIDKEYICNIFKAITIRKCGSGGYTKNNMHQQLKELYEFHNQHYSKTIVKDDILYYDKLSYILAYEAIDMITNINNNIQEHYIDHLNKYVNIVFNVKEKRNEITKNNKDKDKRKELNKELYDKFNKVKKDLMTFGESTSDVEYHSWIKQQRNKLYPNKVKFDKDSIHYDLKSNTQDYLISMFYISTELEKINNNELKDNPDAKQIRLFNVLPLRTNIIAKNICIDTCGLISNFLGDESTSEHLKNYKKDNNQYNLWNRFFKLNNKVFNKNKYLFNNMIKTDGVSCSILFIRKDANGEPLKKTLLNRNNFENNDTEYIERIKITDEIKRMKIVCADPGYSDLIYCGSKDSDGNLETFRYTQSQRRLETRVDKYNKIINDINTKSMIDDKSIKEHEVILSKYNSKTCNYDKFKDYLIEKNKLNYNLYQHYEQKIFRKLKLNRFINTQKSESKMIKNFSNKFGKPDETMFILGDYDKGNHNMKGKEPAICKRFRKIFKNAGYKTYLINEFRTSKLCNECNSELEMFLEKPYKNGKKLCHGLLRCQSIKPQCEIIHNRDKNAVQNMLKIVESVMKIGKRPDKFCRKEQPTNSAIGNTQIFIPAQNVD